MSEIARDENDDSVIFPDGHTTIDYVLVYVNNLRSTLSERNLAAASLREKFIHVLTEKHKIQVIHKIVKTDNKEIGFYLLHLPWEVLIEEAEKLKLKVPLKVLKSQLKEDGLHYALMNKFNLSKMNEFFHHKMPEKQQNQTEVFRRETLHRYDSTPDKLINFRSSQRQYVLKEILNSINYSNETNVVKKIWSQFRSDKYSKSIRFIRLLKQGIFNDAYPPHDGLIEYDDLSRCDLLKEATKKDLKRQLLFRHWARWNCLFKFQPLNEIEEYFGTKIAFYFAWLGFYTSWLLPMALIGVIFFCLGRIDPSFDDSNELICGAMGDKIEMCPLCTECSSWYLSDICFTSKLNRMFDNAFTVVFSLTVNFWAIFFLEFWKRLSKKLGHQWNVLDYERDEEKPSSDYCFYATKEHHNAITGQKEPYFPVWIAKLRRFFSFLVMIAFIGLTLIIHTLLIFLRILIHHYMFLSEDLRSYASLVANTLVSLLNLLAIILIDKLFEKVATKLTRWEMHRTETEYEESLIFKLFVILSFNYYFQAFYIAFLKGRIKININGTIFTETCSHTGCHIEVALYLFVTFAGKQFLKSTFDIYYPRFKRLARVCKTGLSQAKNQWENDYQLNQVESLTSNYLYLVIQFGFINLFAASFPLGPLFAFIFNLLAIRIHARRLLCESRRMVTIRVNGIGVWFKILETLSSLSVLTNAFIIAFSSDFLEKTIYFIENSYSISGFTEANLLFYNHTSTKALEQCRYFESKHHEDLDTSSHHFFRLVTFKLIFIIIYQNIASWVQKYIEISVPDIPRHLDLKIKHKKYLIKEKLRSKSSNLSCAEGLELI